MKKWQCVVCGFIYDEAEGWPDDGIAPGTRSCDGAHGSSRASHSDDTDGCRKNHASPLIAAEPSAANRTAAADQEESSRRRPHAPEPSE